MRYAPTDEDGIKTQVYTNICVYKSDKLSRNKTRAAKKIIRGNEAVLFHNTVLTGMINDKQRTIKDER